MPEQERARASLLWARISEIFAEVWENQEARLTAEAGGEDSLPAVMEKLMDQERAKPELMILAVKRFQEANPEIDLDHLNEADPWQVALGVLKMYSE